MRYNWGMTTSEINASSAPNNLAHAVNWNQAGMLLGFYEFLLKSITWRDPKIPFALREVSQAVKESIDSITPVSEQAIPSNLPMTQTWVVSNWRQPSGNDERHNLVV
jgi:hypothetical protein